MKNTILKYLNPLLALLFFLTFLGYVLYRYGPASIRGSEDMFDFHSICGLLFILVGLIHIIFNWTWVRINIFGIKKRESAPK